MLVSCRGGEGGGCGKGGRKVNEGKREGTGKLKVKVMLLEKIMYKYTSITAKMFLASYVSVLLDSGPRNYTNEL